MRKFERNRMEIIRIKRASTVIRPTLNSNEALINTSKRQF
jgi:hypothetical protein